MARNDNKISAKEYDYIIDLFRSGKTIEEVRALTKWGDEILKRLRAISRRAA